MSLWNVGDRFLLVNMWWNVVMKFLLSVSGVLVVVCVVSVSSVCVVRCWLVF